jgi:ATP-binding cassette subfamily F protein 3
MQKPISNILASITAQKLSYQYDIDTKIFDTVSFKISPGEKVALMGKNGAGKSTLFKIITQEITDFSGNIFIPEGVKIAHAKQSLPESFLSFTIQEFLLHAKNLHTVFLEYETLTDILALPKNFPALKTPLSVESFSDLLSQFSRFVKNASFQEMMVSEENAVELMIALEENTTLPPLLQSEAIKFLRKCPDSDLTLSLKDFLKRFSLYFEHLLQKSWYQHTAKERFFTECMDLLGTLQEKYNDLQSELTSLHHILSVVNLSHLDLSLRLDMLSGGQKSRLMIAYALFSEPNILLLDEPTNNLDHDSYVHLQQYLQNFTGTLLIISHDPEFLSHIVDKTLFIDDKRKNILEFYGNYENTKQEIEALQLREKKYLHRIEKEIQEKKEVYQKRASQAKVYNSATLSKTARKMKDSIEHLEKNKKSVFQETKPVSPFLIPCTVPDESLFAFDTLLVKEQKEIVPFPVFYQIEKSQKILITGDNGKGKSYTLKEAIAYAQYLKISGTETFPQKIFHETENIEVTKENLSSFEKKFWYRENLVLGYYSQDFSLFRLKTTVQQSMEEIHPYRYQDMRSLLAQFLFQETDLQKKIEDLSEGQKALLSWARIVFLQPNILFLDEPTNHINFKHLPALKKAIQKYHGTLIMICHDRSFLEGIPFAQVIDFNTKTRMSEKEWRKTRE